MGGPGDASKALGAGNGAADALLSRISAAVPLMTGGIAEDAREFMPLMRCAHWVVPLMRCVYPGMQRIRFRGAEGSM